MHCPKVGDKSRPQMYGKLPYVAQVRPPQPTLISGGHHRDKLGTDSSGTPSLVVLGGEVRVVDREVVVDLDVLAIQLPGSCMEVIGGVPRTRYHHLCRQSHALGLPRCYYVCMGPPWHRLRRHCIAVHQTQCHFGVQCQYRQAMMQAGQRAVNGPMAEPLKQKMSLIPALHHRIVHPRGQKGTYRNTKWLFRTQSIAMAPTHNVVHSCNAMLLRAILDPLHLLADLLECMHTAINNMSLCVSLKRA